MNLTTMIDPQGRDPQWEQFARDLSHPMFELTTEEMAPLVSYFNAERARGRVFDPVLTSIIRLLELQMIGGADDGDVDDSDYFTDVDETDEDFAGFPRKSGPNIPYAGCSVWSQHVEA